VGSCEDIEEHLDELLLKQLGLEIFLGSGDTGGFSNISLDGE